MNFLAHLHLASATNSSFVGNFLGDFVKGDPAGQFGSEIVRGIRIHRFVDSYTDQHDLVKALKPLFPQSLRRFSPITLDMFWDHCLAKHWHDFEDLPLADFCRRAQLRIAAESRLEKNALPERFQQVSQRVWQDKWLESYAQLDNIIFGLQRMASRSPRMAPLADTGQTLQANYELFSQQFFILYPDLLQATAEFVADN